MSDEATKRRSDEGVWVVVLFCALGSAAWGQTFEDVRPILMQHCVKCHGGEKIKGEFDLTTREGLLHPGHEGVNVVAGKASQSRLMKMIRHEDEPSMPSKAPQLPAEAIARIEKWIDAGAPYDRPLVEKAGKKRPRSEVTDEDRKFWSFAPLGKVNVPQVRNGTWAKTEVDRFILAKLEAKGIAPNGPAEKRKLIRRAYLTTIGLPPPAEEVESFVNHPDPKAWEKLIDRLLASPHYGERWGRHWLDLARFAESHGYEHDYDRNNAYPYRDFVIRALNEDMAFDRFVKLQIAGDEIEPKNPEALLATGFLGAGTHTTQVTAATAEKERYDELDDMIATIGTSMLGMTVGCARCHDHKFDPIPAKDYYRMLATFTTTVRTDADIDLDPAGYEREKARWAAAHGELEKTLKKFEKEELAGRMEKWIAEGGKIVPPRWIVLEGESAKSSGGATIVAQGDGSWLVGGKRPPHDVYTFVVTTPLRRITGLKLEALTDQSMVKRGPGRADNGNFALTNVKVTAAPLSKGQSVDVVLKNPKATFEQEGLPVAATIDPDGTSAWAVDPQFGKDHAAVWEFDKPVDLEGGARLTVTLNFNNNTGHGVGRPRLSVTSGEVELGGEQGSALALEVGALLEKKGWSDAERAKVLAYYRTIDPQWRALKKAIDDDLKNAPQPKKLKAMICSEGVKPLQLHKASGDIPDFYEKTYFLKRGEGSQKDGEAQAGVLSVLVRSNEAKWGVTPPKDAKQSYRRTGLANWITDVDGGAGHLLARVVVNRLWLHHMGRGIVATPNDFGAQGAPPTHPELLDYLARRLISSGWKLKEMHKLIMMSAVYQQSSGFDEARAAVDRENSLWWRRPVTRLEGEVIRDSMLFVSGQLDATMFGPGSVDEAMKRRSIYFFVKRSKMIPMMVLFDGPDTLQSQGHRPTTTVAPQALALMNHPQVSLWAGALAKRVGGGSVEDGVKKAYGIVLGRPPTKEEMADSVAFVSSQEDREKALAAFCQALFCLNEFVYVE